jgi:mannose-6-phosphate isomerase-like protein (cupin superfamily)
VLEKVNLAEKLASFEELFSPRIVGAYNENKVQVVKANGDFIWHSHPETDDFFLVLAGRLTVETREGSVELGPGELVVVPRGVEHRPRAEEEAHVLLIEPMGTPNTGDSGAEPAAEVEI